MMKNKGTLIFSIINRCWEFKEEPNGLYQNLNIYIEENSEEIKNKYLKFVYELSNFEINGIKIHEFFHLENDYNLWWMSKIAEKSTYKSNSIFDAINLIAFEHLIKNKSCKRIRLKIDCIEIRKSILHICNKLNIELIFDCKINLIHKIKNAFSSFLIIYFNFFKGLFLILKKYYSINQLNKPLNKWFSGKKSILIFSYFIHLDPFKSKTGNFYSKQWEILPSLLESNNYKINWIHHFLESKVSKNIKEGYKLINEFNDSNKNNIHSLIDSYVDKSTVFKVLKYYLKIFFGNIIYNSPKNAFVLSNSSINFWNIMKDDWYSSFSGSYMAQNLFWIFQMDKLFKNIPFQKVGFYLNENQGWERCFLTAWKKYNHGKIIAVQHSTVRFWDLRYFDYQNHINNKFSQPQPDYIAVNGPVAYKFYINSKINVKKLIKVEALRYLFHSKLFFNKLKKNDDNCSSNKVLILGNVFKRTTSELLNYLSKNFNKDIQFVLKSHPNAIVDISKYPNLSIFESNDNLESIIANYNYCIAAGDTSSALDAYINDLKVFVYLPKAELNMSPLRDFKDVIFLRSSSHINKDTFFIKKEIMKNGRKIKYFWLDEKLKLWKDLIKKHIHDS